MFINYFLGNLGSLVQASYKDIIFKLTGKANTLKLLPLECQVVMFLKLKGTYQIQNNPITRWLRNLKTIICSEVNHLFLIHIRVFITRN